MSESEFLRQIDALLKARKWDTATHQKIDSDIQTIAFRAVDFYVNRRQQPASPMRRSTAASRPKPPIPRRLVSVYVAAST